jgi:hypothetical protein
MKSKLIIFVLLILTLLGCDIKASQHNENDISEISKVFLNALFIEKNIDKAYSLFENEFKISVPKIPFQESIANAHKGILPTNFEIYDYETYSGEEFISVFAKTTNYKDEMFYRISLGGTKKKGYKIVGIHLSHQEIPPKGNRRSLIEKLTIKGT